MASVPSIGCLLARNQYYRKASISSVSSLSGSDSVNVIPDDKSQQELPKVAESDWWFKSFFHSEPELSDVRRKDLSASRKQITIIYSSEKETWLPGEMVPDRKGQGKKNEPGPSYGVKEKERLKHDVDVKMTQEPIGQTWDNFSNKIKIVTGRQKPAGVPISQTGSADTQTAKV